MRSFECCLQTLVLHDDMRARFMHTQAGQAQLQLVTPNSSLCDGVLMPAPRSAVEMGGGIGEGVCFKEFAIPRTWEDAQAVCKRWGGRLAVLDSEPLTDFVYTYVRRSPCVHSTSWEQEQVFASLQTHLASPISVDGIVSARFGIHPRARAHTHTHTHIHILYIGLCPRRATPHGGRLFQRRPRAEPRRRPRRKRAISGQRQAVCGHGSG